MNLAEIKIRKEEIEKQRTKVVNKVLKLLGEVNQEDKLIEMIEEVCEKFTDCSLIREDNGEIYVAFNKSLYSESEQDDLKHTICHLIGIDKPLYRTKVIEVIDMSIVQERKNIIRNELLKLNGTKGTEEEIRAILRKICEKNRCIFNHWDYEYDRIYLEDDEINYIASIDYTYSDNEGQFDDEFEEIIIMEVIC